MTTTGKEDWCDGCTSRRESVALYVRSTITDVPRQVSYCRECYERVLDDGDTLALDRVPGGP